MARAYKGAIMNPEKLKAALKLNEIENRMNILNECISKTEDSLIATRQVQAITRQQLADARAALAALPDDAA